MDRAKPLQPGQLFRVPLGHGRSARCRVGKDGRVIFHLTREGPVAILVLPAAGVTAAGVADAIGGLVLGRAEAAAAGLGDLQGVIRTGGQDTQLCVRRSDNRGNEVGVTVQDGDDWRTVARALCHSLIGRYGDRPVTPTKQQLQLLTRT